MGNKSPEKFTQWVMLLSLLYFKLVRRLSSRQKQAESQATENYQSEKIISRKRSKVLNKPKGFRYRQVDAEGETVFESTPRKQTPPNNL